MNAVSDSVGLLAPATTTPSQVKDLNKLKNCASFVPWTVISYSMYLSDSEYLVQYDDDDWLPGKWKNLSTYPGNLNSVILHLNPFTYYEFRVIAINEIGMSRPSRPSKRFQSSGAREFVAPELQIWL